MLSIDQFLVQETTSLRAALAMIDRTGEGILLLIDARGSLRRTVTDGDIRRLLLDGASMEQTLDLLPKIDSKVVRKGTGLQEALEIMNQWGINHLPVLDNEQRLVSLLLRRELDNEILLSPPHLGLFEKDFVSEAFSSNWIAPLGPNVDAFERELASYVGIEHAAAVNSGTSAIHLGLRLLDVAEGDRVICSTLTFVASANPILYQRAEPILIDSEPASWNMSPQALERALADAARARSLPKAVIVVNLYGQSADMHPILELCNRYEVPVLEDAAESLGASYRGQASGTFGRIGVYSFNGNKIITTSGGGMLVSRDEKVIERARKLATQARDPAPHYQHSEVGYNYRMSNVLAGIGRGQLKVLNERVQARRAVFERYVAGLSHLAALRWMPEASFGRATRWLTTAVLDPQLTRITPNQLREVLLSQRIEARPIWKPLHRQPLFQGCRYYPHRDDNSFSDDLFASGICLPSGSNLSLFQQQRIVDAIEDLLRHG